MFNLLTVSLPPRCILLRFYKLLFRPRHVFCFSIFLVPLTGLLVPPMIILVFLMSLNQTLLPPTTFCLLAVVQSDLLTWNSFPKFQIVHCFEPFGATLTRHSKSLADGFSRAPVFQSIQYLSLSAGLGLGGWEELLELVLYNSCSQMLFAPFCTKLCSIWWVEMHQTDT